MLFKCAVLFALIVNVLCGNIYLYEEPIGILYNYTFKNIEAKNKVQILDLRGNGIEYISHLAFSGFDNLERLALMQNKINCLPQNVFNDVKNIDFLGLDENKIKHLHKNVFSKLQKLKNVRLQHNLLSNLEIGLFDNNVALDDINLHDNRLTFIPEGLFSKLPNLKTLNLGMNYIQHIEKFALPPSIRTLMLFVNRLQHFDVSENIVNSLTYSSMDKNPFYCDCNLKPLYKRWKSNLQSHGWSPSCDGPKHLKNRAWSTLGENDFVCNPNETEFRLESNDIIRSGENVVLLCRVNHIVSEMTITYNNETKVVDHLRRNNRLYYTQFVSTEKESWYNLTIKNIQVYDSGNYKCLVNGKEEKISMLTVQNSDDNECCDVAPL